MKFTVLISIALLLFSAYLGISTALVPELSGRDPPLSALLLTAVSDGVNKSMENGSLANEIARENSKDSIFDEEGRNSKRGGVLRKIALPLLLLFGLKTGIAVPLVFGTVALAAFKGLWSGLTALVVTAALALRGLLPPPRIVQLPPPPPPHHAHITDYYTDYRRADALSRGDDYRYGW
uniref:Putative secreted peptide n=2 Tax=Triatoma infestans TaxID=30076 RepID=A0A023EY08_TRIIF